MLEIDINKDRVATVIHRQPTEILRQNQEYASSIHRSLDRPTNWFDAIVNREVNLRENGSIFYKR